MESFHLPNLDRYCGDYGRLARALGVADATPAPGELEFLRVVTTPKRFDFGMLSPSEIFFAAAVTSILRPRLALEIGTASGSSAAIIAKMIALRLAESGREISGPLIHTIDKRADYVFDPTKPIGFAIEEMTPELGHQIALHPRRSSLHCREIVGGAEVTLAFIDGNHRHPWPLSDVLQIQALMKSGWILMHDIDLPGLIASALASGQKVEHAPASGAKHVFDYWPEEKIRSGNIGAIKIPADRGSLGDFVARLRDLPAEVSPGSWTKQWRVIDSLMNSPTRRRFFRAVWPVGPRRR